MRLPSKSVPCSSLLVLCVFYSAFLSLSTCGSVEAFVTKTTVSTTIAQWIVYQRLGKPTLRWNTPLSMSVVPTPPPSRPSDVRQDGTNEMATADAVAIIAGTATGGGFLALPQVTSPLGYLPTVLGLCSAYVFLTLAALAFCEAAGLADEEASIEHEMNPKASGTSVASVIAKTFGAKWAMLAGAGFLTQMVAVLTAQVAKGAEILALTTGLPYRIACILPFAAVATWVYTNSPHRVERVNTALTALMLGGFAALIASALSHMPPAVWVTTLLSGKADWTRLLPNAETPFALPLFVKLLSFGQAMPLLIERMVVEPQRKLQNPYHTTRQDTDQTKASYGKVRRATVMGAALPLLLAIIWAGISSSLVDPADPNPIFSLLQNYGAPVAVPVLILSYGAIGTTLLGSLMALSHFAREIIVKQDFGGCNTNTISSSRHDGATIVANLLAVGVPSTLACIDPSIYLPLLSFAGAYPTTLLYGLAPCLAALVLRQRVTKKRIKNRMGSVSTPKLVPGGRGTLVFTVLAALGLVGSSTGLVIKKIVGF